MILSILPLIPFKKISFKSFDVVYDAEHVLDEIATEALQRKLDVEFQTTASKVRNSISTFLSHFCQGDRAEDKRAT
jgi:hypothetical protein